MSNTSNTLAPLSQRLKKRFTSAVSIADAYNEITLEVPAQDILKICLALRDEDDFKFDELIDLCGVDYLAHGDVEWETVYATEAGFSRGVHRMLDGTPPPGKTGDNATCRRFAVVYHLLSIDHNERLRLKVFLPNDEPVLDSVVDIWSCANWFEREAFDLFGILFKSHPDLRRILTDYGFIGHPFRKDFPLIGNVEMRYDTEKQRVVYEPVSIEPRTLVPRVKRDDHRYIDKGSSNGGAN
ncbi:MAG: NADH-quinone oxidoreductase subunit C [Gammaproteobacteria bacterium]|nr:NADH-quinone oxidoreductase subunit C [Gammaproteobacteria bacterium]